MPTRVLIVEDEPATREGLAELLETAGYETVAVDGFESARQILRTDRPDVLITDIRLGDYNGLHLLINEPCVPAIVISGFPDPVLRSDAESLGAAYLTKPVSPAAVLELVKQRRRSESLEMAVTPSRCPYCESHDLRTLYRDAELRTYRCHECARTFHVGAG